MAGNVIVAGFSFGQGGIPIHLIGGHLDAQLIQVFHNQLRDGRVAGVGVEEVVDVNGVGSQELAVVTELIAGFFQYLPGPVEILLIGVVTRCVSVRIGVFSCILLKLVTCAVQHHGRNEGVGQCLPRLPYSVNNVLTVNRVGDGKTHFVGLLGRQTVKHLGVDVEDDEVGAQVVNHMEFRILVFEELLDLIGRDIVDEVQIAGLIGRVDGRVIIVQHEVQFLQLDIVRAVEVFVLLKGDTRVVNPSGVLEGTVGDVVTVLCPGGRVLDLAIGIHIAGGSLNRGLVDREVGRECAKIQEVGCNCLQFDGQCFAVF